MCRVLSTVVLLVCLSVKVLSNQLTVGDEQWYENNKHLQLQSMQLADKLKQQINQQPQPLISVYSSSRPKYRCEIDIESCVPLLIQQNVDASNFFNRSWKEFKRGFNGSNGNYWIGNELLHQLTKNGRYKLRFDLQSYTNKGWYWAEYNPFIVFNEATQYEVLVDVYTGNAGFDAFRYSSKRKFSTYDRDNDVWSKNCAAVSAGGFWYAACAHACPNAMHGTRSSFYWSGLPGGGRLQTSRMWLLCR